MEQEYPMGETCSQEETKDKSQLSVEGTKIITTPSPLIYGKEFTNDFSYQKFENESKLHQLLQMEKGYLFKDLDRVNTKQMEEEYENIGNYTEGPEYDQNLVDNKDLNIHSANRYSDILPYQTSQVKLKSGRYINANYINSVFGQDQKIIATQGPKENTIQVFWEMIYEFKVSHIFMLCRLEEKGQQKCDFYWPSFGKPMILKDIDLEIQTESQQSENLYERTFRLNHKKNLVTREVKQIYYSGWPDHGVPNSQHWSQVEDMANQVVQLFYKNKEDQKIVLHCSAGVGRTGTVITLANIQMIFNYYKENSQEGIENNRISIFSLVRRLREQRVCMVQTFEQYKLLYQLTKQMIEKTPKNSQETPQQ